jgi:hypothetical protein
MALTTVDQGLLNSYAQYTGFKNRIINGAMMIDQRKAGASNTFSSSYTYFLDRFVAWGNVSSSTTIQQVADAPAGFYNSLKITVGTGATPSGSDYGRLQQPIEGFNWQDMRWGFSDAKSITISFWVKSSLTGTFGCGMQGQTYFYSGSYTISSANTWEYKTITIAGYTSGGTTEFPVNNSAGAILFFDLGEGPSRSLTVNTWTLNASFSMNGLTGGTKVLATSGATWQLTGVQIEKGSTATSFDYRPYGTELALCQRYYWKMYNDPYNTFGCGYANSATQATIQINYPCQMRANPTFAIGGNIRTIPTVSTVTGIPYSQVGLLSGYVGFTGSGLTTNATCLVGANNDTTAYLSASSEL